jgi:predicted DNA-binding transcriptional regulator YafY
VKPAVHAAIGEALMNDHQLEVEHHSAARDRPSQLTLNPLALILRGPILYLAATAQGHEDVRLYAVHRIRRATELPKAASIPRGFDIDQQIAAGLGQFGDSPLSPERLKLVLLCAGWLARQLEESPLSTDQKITRLDDGRARVSATVLKSWQLQWWLLARLGAVEVIAPARYRKELAVLLERGASRHRTISLEELA